MNILLIPLSVIFCLSLGGSVVLFKFLKSSATIKKPTFQAGGALAGFILIYWLLYSSFNSWYEPPPTKWTIRGQVTKEEAVYHDGITVRYVPPSEDESDKEGYFRLENVPEFPGEGGVQFEDGSKEFHQRTVWFTDLDKMDIEINRERKLILLKKNVVLPKSTE